jgi:hypothetical protein
LLRDSQSQSSGSDEPSFGLLAHLIEETGFRHVWAALNFRVNMLGVPVEETLEEFAPLYAGHRFKDAILCFDPDREAVEEAKARLWSALQTFEPELEYTSLSLVSGETKLGMVLASILTRVPVVYFVAFRHRRV